MKEIEYLVCYGGGIGDRVWDEELIIESPPNNIKLALESATKKLDEDEKIPDYTIYSIEQWEG